MRRVVIGSVLLLLAVGAVGAYLASPFVTLWQLGRALRAHDSWAIVSHVDFPSLRQSMSEQLTAIYLGRQRTGPRQHPAVQPAAVQLFVAPQLVDALVRQLVTPTGVRAAIDNGWIEKLVLTGSPGPGAAPISGDAARPEIGRAAGMLRDWGFSSPPRFHISLGKTDDPEQWVTLRLRFSGFRWQVYAIELPTDAGKELLSGRVRV